MPRAGVARRRAGRRHHRQHDQPDVLATEAWVPDRRRRLIPARRDDPFDPVSAWARHCVAEQGDATPIDWVHRDDRYGEKLATPDTSIADLIGEVDPIKVAEGHHLSDEYTIHFGMLPRTHRGIFCINELPDLTEKVQVGLFNVMQERDVQVKGYRVDYRNVAASRDLPRAAGPDRRLVARSMGQRRLGDDDNKQ